MLYIKNFCYFVFLFRIGQCISTKAIGKFEREDITDDYKHDESKLHFTEFFALTIFYEIRGNF